MTQFTVISRRYAEKPVTRTVDFPDDWNDLTKEQIASVLAIRYSGWNELEQCQRMFRSLGSFTPHELSLMNMEDFVVMNDEREDEFMPFLKPFFQDPQLPHSILPYIEHDGVKYEGPRDGLTNFVVLQMSFSDLNLQALQQEQNTKALDLLIGTLYKPEGMSWHNAHIEEHAAALSSLPFATKMQAALNYLSLRKQVSAQYPNTFAGGSSDDFGIYGMIESIAGDKFGKADECGFQPLHPVLVSCERSIIRNRELEKK